MPVELWQMVTTASWPHTQLLVTSADTMFIWDFYNGKEAKQESANVITTVYSLFQFMYI